MHAVHDLQAVASSVPYCSFLCFIRLNSHQIDNLAKTNQILIRA
jgi:hypothetical protein